MAIAVVRLPPEARPGPGDGERHTPEPEAPLEITVDWRRLAARVLLVCLAAELLLFALDYHVNYGRLIDVGAMRRLFNTAREDGLASWFASTQTLLVGLTLLGLFAIDRSRGYLILALGFCYLAVDDGAQLHERFSSTFDALTERSTLAAAFPSYTWHVLFLPPFAALGLYLLAFLWTKLDRSTPRLLLAIAIALMAVAVGLDFVEGLDRERSESPYTLAVSRHPAIDAWSQRRFHTSGIESLRHFSKSLEETLEMAAMSLLWFVVLNHAGGTARDLRVRSGGHR